MISDRLVMQRSTGLLPSLTGLRGIAAMGVFLCHFQPIALSFFGVDPNRALTIISSGFRGVDLFCGFRRSRPGIPSVFRAPFQSDGAHQSNLMAPRVGVVS
jgi:hypothetical protein